MSIKLIDLEQELSALPIEADKVPYSFTIKFDKETYKIVIKYNSVAEFFTIDLYNNTGEALCFGDIIRYGRPLFAPIEDERFPLPVIIPLAPGGGETEVNKENLGKSVNLFIIPREGPEVIDK